MQQFIEQVSAGVDKMTQLVESGQYDLVKDGLTIPPQQWEALVRPGASIKMCDRAEKVLPSTSKSRLPISVDAAKPSRKISWLRKSSAKTVDQKESVLKKRESSSSERFPDIPTTHSSTEKVDQGARGRIAGSSSNADGDGPGAF
ncbi:hypothetical protein BDV96DRAFT_181881 [Lophiotrema nucula]|uniref:Ubiquitin-like domain-containing protein n=1 Tax=Lophiotrema nucula TaxID=690887 RepID=A0A6A5YW63_9PLEO|nr:hypothetical protein BDV96DRAFT_181881 [Lophiotrema nucula]